MFLCGVASICNIAPANGVLKYFEGPVKPGQHLPIRGSRSHIGVFPQLSPLLAHPLVLDVEAFIPSRKACTDHSVHSATALNF